MIDLAKFETRLRSVHRVDSRRRATYSPDLLAMAERLHLESRLPLKTIATELANEPAFKDVSWRAIHSRLCRHIRGLKEQKSGEVSARRSRKKPR